MLLYVHVAADHYVISCGEGDTLACLMGAAEVAYASVFRAKPPVSIRAITNASGCFLPPALVVAQVLTPEEHIYAVVDTEPAYNDNEPPLDAFKRVVASWSQWQLYMVQLLWTMTQDPIVAISDLLACGAFKVLGSLLFSSDMQILRLALQVLERCMSVDCLSAARLFTQLLATKRLPDDPFVPTTLLRLLHTFCAESREAQTLLLEEGISSRLLALVDAVKTPEAAHAIDATLCLLQDSALLGRRPRSSRSNQSSPPMALQEIMYLLHSKQPKSLDVASKQLLLLAATEDDWAAAMAGSSAERAIFTELLHVAGSSFRTSHTVHMVVLGRFLSVMQSVAAFSTSTVLSDPGAIDYLLSLTSAASTYPSGIQEQAAQLLGRILLQSGEPLHCNGLIAMLCNTAPPIRDVATEVIASLLERDESPRMKESLVHRLMQDDILAICIDMLYAPSQRRQMLQILNIVLQEEDARDRVVDRFQCVSLFVSLLVDASWDVDGQRLAAKALAKLALSTYNLDNARF
ncbi:hypothetical protein SDRG_08251 [Saprolegnia diclina VS20]|uniref:Uncharacterized protein n=1 Tax=Saprolegnia diclina (strain VS20) TaxID=1156394 RepID=T0RUL5_SAPDV|nr:hypothetical protein SDRG_08251 [Saprolegnia diclina VS20]EQC34037.1 hypothetical protein SDRG_08251 [Saprolegnia diclina VS20]|eukprot:XP_008612349.1 hypothetical protein SDRG_08251 [Saprolegnia diclina VS20]